jgi:hypothetical protein
MARYFIGGVANATFYNGSDIILKSQTLSESTINISADKVEVRGGIGAKLLGQYFHTSQMQMTLTDAVFNLDYIAMNAGAVKNIGGVDYATETITLGSGGAGTITGTPIMFGSAYVGWAAIQGTDTYQTVTINPTSKAFTYTGGTTGTVVCITYPITSSGEYITIPATIIPSTVHAVLTANLYNAGGSTNDISTATLVGHVNIDIPRLQLMGTQNISMTATGVSNTPLSGMALAVDSASCDGAAYYATITTATSENWYDNLTMLSFLDGTISVATGNSANIVTYGVGANIAPYLIAPANLTYTGATGSEAVATVAAGVITPVAAGTTTYVVSITAKPEVNGTVTITVA